MININETLFLKTILIILTICDYNPIRKSIWIFSVARISQLICNVLFFVLVLLYFYFNVKHMSIDIVSSIMEAFVSAIHVIYHKLNESVTENNNYF